MRCNYLTLGNMVKRKICYGIVQPGQSVTDGIPVIKVNNLISGLKSLSELDTTTRENEAKYIRTRLHGGELIISVVGTIGKTAIVPKSFAGCNLVRATALIDIEDALLSKWVKYYIDSPYGQSYIEQNLNTTVQPTLNIKSLEKMSIPLYDAEYMEKIVILLSSLDEKIAINREINDNLEQQLRTIFKAEFTDNPELENITQIPLSELCHVVTKGTTPTTLGKPFVESGINFIKAESILDDHSIDKSKFAFIDEETNALIKRSIIHAGDVVFTIAGTLGRFALIDENVLPANTNQAVAIIRADVEKVLPEYIYTCFIGEWHTDYYAKRVQQAVQANLSLTTIKSLPIPLLDEAKMSEYLSLILPLIKAIKTNEAQNEKLAALRDNLLPKLMSGEIDVSDVQL